MRLLDDARALLDEGPPDWDDDRGMWECRSCNATTGPFADVERDSEAGFVEFVHQDDCPWLSMPKIVAALEVAEQVAVRWRADISRRCDEPVAPVVRLARLGLLFRDLDVLVAVEDG